MSEYKNGGNNNMLWEQGPGSNLGTPTQKTKELQKCDSFFYLQTIYSNFNSYISKTIRVKHFLLHNYNNLWCVMRFYNMSI